MAARVAWLRKSPVRVELLLAFFFLLLLGLPNLVYPFGTDQGEYAHIASEMLAGKVIYRDVFNVKPPGTHALHAVALVVFGRSMLSLRLLDWLWQAGAGVSIAAIVWLLYQRRGAPLLAAILYAIGYYSVDFWHSAQTDGFVNFPAALAVLCFLLALRRLEQGTTIGNRPLILLCLGAGMMTSIAVLLKYPIGLLLPFILLILFLAQGVRRETFLAAGWVVAGFALPLLLFATVSAARGGLQAFLDIQFGYIPAYNSGFARDQSYLAYTWDRFVLFWDLKPTIRLFTAIWLAELLLSGLVTRWPRPQWIVPLWGVAGLVYPAVQNHYNDGHMHTILPPLAIMAIHLLLNVDALLQHYGPRFRPAVALAGVALPFLVLFLPQSPYAHRNLEEKFADFAAVVSGQRTLEDNYVNGNYGTYGWGFSARAIVEMSHYLREHTRPEDPIFVWSFEPAVYFLSERQSASRFIFNFPLYGDFAWPEYRDQFLAEMETHRPEIILVARNDAMPWVSGTEDDSQAAFDKFRAFRAFVESSYEPVAQVAQFTVYERVAP